MVDRLEEYRRKRDARRTPEPVPVGPPPRGNDDTFVIQQHHARRLHWDLRLERDGVLVSWAIPRGVPRDPERNHLAVHTEDHPLEYATFHGAIPAGEYGGGTMTIYDRGTYETEKWRDREVIVILHGTRVSGRYALFRTRGRDWMIHRMDPPEPGWTPMPPLPAPMQPVPAKRLPADDDAWGYELAWAGLRVRCPVAGGQLQVLPVEGPDAVKAFPELRGLAEALAPAECIVDGEIVAFDQAGRVSPTALAPRLDAIGTEPSAAFRRLVARHPVQLLAYDLLWLDGVSTVELPYRQRRELLEAVGVAGAHWQTPPYFPGGGTFALDTAKAQGLAAVVAKRLDSPYQAGRHRSWLAVAAR